MQVCLNHTKLIAISFKLLQTMSCNNIHQCLQKSRSWSNKWTKRVDSDIPIWYFLQNVIHNLTAGHPMT